MDFTIQFQIEIHAKYTCRPLSCDWIIGSESNDLFHFLYSLILDGWYTYIHVLSLPSTTGNLFSKRIIVL